MPLGQSFRLTAGVMLLSAASFGNNFANNFLIDFETVPVYTLTPFSVTDGSLVATFTGQYGVFGVWATAGNFQSLTGNILMTENPGDILWIQFSQPVRTLSLNFVITGGGNMDLFGYSGGTPVFLTSAMGTVPTGYLYPEGVLSYTGLPYNIFGVAPTLPVAMAVDNLRGSAVPEPTSGALMLVAAGGLAAAVWRRRRT